MTALSCGLRVCWSVRPLARWIDAHGHRSTGPVRELYLECPADPALWVTELQEPLTDG